jgi:hypothetical protein
MKHNLTRKISILLVICLLFSTSTAFAQINWSVIDGQPNAVQVDLSNLNIPDSVTDDVYLELTSNGTNDTLRYLIQNPTQPYSQTFYWDTQNTDQAKLWLSHSDQIIAKVTVGEDVYDESTLNFDSYTMGISVKVVDPDSSPINN